MLVAAIALTACGGPGTVQPTASPPATPAGLVATPAAVPGATVTRTPTSRTPSAGTTTSAARIPSPASTMPGLPPVVNLAIAALAAERGVPAAAIELVRVEPREWPNTGLGCPEPGRAYLDVITPGYAITLRVRGGGETYEYHSDEARMVVRCQGGGEATPSPRRTPMTNLPPAARTAIAALANELGLRQDEISVASADEAEWSDSSLGCPEPGRAYLQVITPGYRIVLVARGQQYVYHTDRGTRAVRCGQR